MHLSVTGAHSTRFASPFICILSFIIFFKVKKNALSFINLLLLQNVHTKKKNRLKVKKLNENLYYVQQEVEA